MTIREQSLSRFIRCGGRIRRLTTKMTGRSKATRIVAPTRFTTDERHEEYDMQDEGDKYV